MATEVDIQDIVAASQSDVGGKRSDNQDLFGDFRHGSGGRLLMLADGMGGRRGGASASRVCVDALSDYFQDETGTPEERLVRCFEHANRLILEHANSDESLKGMGTTGVALLFTTDGAYVAWVGDSRAYRWRAGVLVPLTRDHSLVQEWVRTGVLSAEEAASHPRRNELLRAVGIAPEIEVEVVAVDLRPGDRFLLCSDGLCGVVPHDEMAETIARHDPEDAARRFVERAMELRSRDNITVQVAAFGEDLRAAQGYEHVPPVTEQVEAALRRRERRGPSLHGSSALFGAGAAVFLSLVAFSYWNSISTRPEPQPYPERAQATRRVERGSVEPRPRARPQPRPEELAQSKPQSVEVPPKPAPLAPSEPEPIRFVPPAQEKPSEPETLPASPAAEAYEAPSAPPAPLESFPSATALGIAPAVHAFVSDWLEAARDGDLDRYRALGFPISDAEFESSYARWEDFRVQSADVDVRRSRPDRVYLRVVLSYAFHDARGRWRTEDEHRIVLAETPDGLRYHARWR